MNDLQSADPRVLQECLRVLEGLVQQQQVQQLQRVPAVAQHPAYAAQAANYAGQMEPGRNINNMGQPMHASLPVYQGRGLRMPQVIRPVPSPAAAVPQRINMLVERVISDRMRERSTILPKMAGNGIDMLVSSAQLLNSSEAADVVMGQGTTPAEMQRMRANASQAQYSHIPSMPQENTSQHKVLNSDEDEIHYDDDVDKEAARLEHSRRKNREAQQRFRDKRKQMLIDMEKEYDDICIVCDNMEISNDTLREHSDFLSRDLVVCELMLMSLERKPPAKDSILAQILTDKEVKEIEKNTTRVEQTGTPGEPVSGSHRSSDQAEEVTPEEVPDEVQEMRKIAKSLDSPDAFQLYWREWQVELKHLLQVHLEDGDESSLRDIRNKFDKMVKVWTYNTRLYPNIFKIVTSKMTLNDNEKTELWRELAVEIMKSTPEANVKQLYRFWKKYLSKMDLLKGYREKADLSLAQLEHSHSKVSPENYSFYNLGRYHIETAALAYEVNQIAEKTWRYSLRLCTAWALAIGEANIALCHAKTQPNMPNWIMISRDMIDIAVKNGTILVDDEDEDFSEPKSMEDLFS
eukprot:jgi/Picsp_1/1757/NSC_05229-R1_hypothetical protein CHLNCDRAFT_136809 [Chlorella variabilis]